MSATRSRRAPKKVRGRARRIVTLGGRGAGILRQRSRAVPVVDGSVRVLIADMIESMRRARGIGLAAPQIGVPLRVIVADVGRGPVAVVNPRLRRRGGIQVGIEGCLSIPGIYGEVRRAQWVEVDGRSPWGRRVVVRSRDLLARVFQHEVDHLNGVLFTDPGRLVRRLRPAGRARRPGRRRAR